MASHIPKFASFRPKPKAAVAADHFNLGVPQDIRKKEHSGESDKPKRREKEKLSSPEAQTHEAKLPASKVFFSDRRGDPEVLRYGTLHQYDIPTYQRYGYGCVLGLSPAQKIDRQYTSSKEMCLTPVVRQQQERLLTNIRYNKSTSRALKLVKTEEEHIDLNLDFVPFTNSGKTKDEEHSDEDEQIASTDYRSIEGKAKSTEPIDPDTLYETEILKGVDSEITRINSKLIQRTRDHPEDLEGWLALVNHQEAMLKLEQATFELSVSAKARLAEVRISIYQDALKKVKTDQKKHSKIYQCLLREAREIWDDTKLDNIWNQVLTKHADNVDLWFLYLDFIQSAITQFNYERCRSIFLKCSESLRTSAESTPATILHILLRLTCMTSDAGYQELALAIWQALFEFLIMYPTGNSASLDAFEEFWDSEVPRIGERGARGWKYHTANESPPPEAPEVMRPDPSASFFQSFEQCEVDAMAKLKYPGRTSHVSGEDDTFHTIFFSDIEPVLRSVPKDVPPNLLLDAFLCFSGLPSLPGLSTQLPRWWSDPFLYRHSRSISRIQDLSSNSTIQTFGHLSACYVQGFLMTTEHLFEQECLVGAADHAEFVRRLLTLLTSGYSCEDSIGEYLLAFELSHFPLNVHKTAKNLLKARPTSRHLYNAYGLVESHRANTAKADQVFRMALSMQQEHDVISSPVSLELRSNWVWEALQRRQQMQAFWRLVSPSETLQDPINTDRPPDEGLVKRAHTLLSEATQRLLLCGDYPSAIMSTSLSALLVYLQGNQNISQALSVHQNLFSWFTSHKLSESTPAELHAQTILRLLKHHITHTSVVKPLFIRQTLEPLLANFPNNTLLLALYTANEARFSIDDRVRGIMRQSILHTSQEPTLAGCAFTIQYELLRGEIAGSTSHSIRAAYQRATASAAAHCPTIWKAYVLFELEQVHQVAHRQSTYTTSKAGQKDTWSAQVTETKRRLRDTFFAGLRQIPWCKEYVMLAFTEASDMFDEEQKRKLYAFMQEKEMRIYIDLNETT